MLRHVTTVGQGTALQPNYARVTETLCRNSVALRCIATEKACVHDRPSQVRTTRLGAHDRGILLRLGFLYRDSLLRVVKKKGPLGIAASHIA